MKHLSAEDFTGVPMLGVRIDPMTSTARDALATAAKYAGRIIYLTDLNIYQFFDGTSWEDLPGNAFQKITDGTNTAVASKPDETFKMRSSDLSVNITVADHDATHGDSVNLTVNQAKIDHVNLLSKGSKTHDQIDSHIADGTIHFTQAAIDHVNILNKGSNTHAAIDSHIANSAIHFTQASIDHGSITGLGDDDHVIYSKADGTRAFTGVVSGVTPTQAAHLATKDYVDNRVAGIRDIKDAVRVATTSSVSYTYTAGTKTLSGCPSSLDGVTLVLGDRILVKNHATGSSNGIYTITTLGTGTNGVWTRATDADESSEVTSGLSVFVTSGTTNGATGWILTTQDTITLDTTALVFTQVSGQGQYILANLSGGTGNIFSSVSGTTFNLRSLKSTTTALTVADNGNTVDFTVNPANIDKNAVGGSALTVANGGTGSTTAAAARANLGATTKYSTDIGNGTLTAILVTHNLATQDVIVQVRRKASPYDVVSCDIEITDTNNVKFYFGVAPASGEYRVIIIG